MAEHGEPTDLAIGQPIDALDGVSGVDIVASVATIDRLAELDPQRWTIVEQALQEHDYPYRVNWRDLPPVDDVYGRLAVMAAVKGVLPDNNPEIQKDTHNVTLENHVKLLLEAAGTRENLDLFLELVQARLSTGSTDEARELARQTFLIYAPAAEVAGRPEVKRQLEELAFETLYPEEKQKIIDTYSQLGGRKALYTAEERYKAEIAEALLTGLPDLGKHFGIETRRKSYYSVWRKCQQRGATSYQLPDFFGVRVLVDSRPSEEWAVGQCYAVASEICQLYEPVLDRLKDYIARPKESGYRSLQMTLTDQHDLQLEVQIRTTAMSEELKKDPRTLHSMYDAAHKITPGRYFRQAAKPNKAYLWRVSAAQQIREREDGRLDNLRPEKVLVFAYDGNLYEFDAGDTALDFSFKIHDRRALRTKRIFVNGKLAGFGDKLQQGDWVNVQYRRKGPRQQTVGLNWLDLVHSRRAVRRINRTEKERHAQEYIARAIVEIDEHFPDLDNPLGCLTEQDLRQVCRRYSVDSFDRVLREIGAGSVRKVMRHGQLQTEKVTCVKLVKQIERRLEKNKGTPTNK